MADILYDYQLEALNKLRNGNILCGGVGSGKSRTGLGYYFKEQGGSLSPFKPMPKKPKDLYIITTARKRDTKEWDGDMIPYLLSSDKETNYYENEVVVDSWNNIIKYKEVEGAFFIFDEQRVVGSGTWVKSFLRITKNNEWILLSATPGDTWTDYIPVFIANGFYKNRTEFLRRHAVYSYYSKYPKIIKFVDQGRLIRLRKEILVTMNYERETVYHKENIPVGYDVSKYDNTMKNRWNPYKDLPIENISELCYTLRKIVNSDSERIRTVEQLSSEHKRMIVFYNFDYELYILRNANYPKGTQIAEWTGHHHESIPDSDRWVYLVQYAAGAEGWNCTLTDTIVFYSRSYSYKATIQAQGRIDRLNTPYKDLYYYFLQSNASIDKAIERSLRKKQNFNESSFIQ